MEMVGHQNVPAHEPGIRLMPGLDQRLMNDIGGEPGLPVASANGEENDGWQVGFRVDTVDRMLARFSCFEREFGRVEAFPLSRAWLGGSLALPDSPLPDSPLPGLAIRGCYHAVHPPSRIMLEPVM